MNAYLCLYWHISKKDINKISVLSTKNLKTLRKIEQGIRSRLQMHLHRRGFPRNLFFLKRRAAHPDEKRLTILCTDRKTQVSRALFL
jgi:hypothetical protein